MQTQNASFTTFILRLLQDNPFPDTQFHQVTPTTIGIITTEADWKILKHITDIAGDNDTDILGYNLTNNMEQDEEGNWNTTLLFTLTHAES